MGTIRHDLAQSDSKQNTVNAGKLENQIILILGGSGRMGLAIAKLAAAEGAQVTLVGRNADSLAIGSKRLFSNGDAPRCLVGDATDEIRMKQLLREIGWLDHIVVATSSGTNSPVPPEASIPHVNLSTVQATYSRLWAAYTALHLAPLHVRPGGSVTVLSGASSRRPHFGFGIYGALHGALEALARAAAIELAPIRVNVVSPGNIGVRPARQLAQHQGRFEDLAAGVIGVMSNPAIAAAVLDVDGGEGLGSWPNTSSAGSHSKGSAA